MADINLYVPILKQWEGGFSENPNDSGGATNIGVTLSTFQNFFGADKTVDDLKNITDEQLATVIKSYWDAINGDNINDQQCANCLADWAYNAGQKVAINAAQTIVGIDPPTGFCGDITVGKINATDPKTLCDSIVGARIKFYHDLVAAQPHNAEFLTGWIRRASSFYYKEPA